ncbi:MAG: AraC family transcriptional regulator [Sphingobacteriales bacterium]|nr:MAG: AraC family transcriptional regulator [Sphingobacteriales bacterium]
MKQEGKVTDHIDCNTCIAQVYNVDRTKKENSIKEYFFKDFWLCFGNVMHEREKLVNFDCAEPSVKMVFQFCGSRALKLSDFSDVLEMSCNSHALFYTNANSGQVRVSGCEEQGFLEVNFQPKFLLSYLPDNDSFLTLVEGIHKKESIFLRSENNTITVAMQAIIDSILESDREGGLQHLFLESKVKELLLLQIESYIRKPHQDAELIQKYHAGKIYQAKAIIEANIGKPCSLIDLAHQVGTNECTLKKGFRALLDTSVHNYWNELKMKKAMKMLTESDASVADISMDIGFKTPQHFSTAFKKYYGITPGTARLKKK